MKKSIFVVAISVAFFIFFPVVTFAQTEVPTTPGLTPLLPTIVPTDIPLPSPTTPFLDAPHGVKAIAIDHKQIDVTWGVVSKASSYEVYRNNEFFAVIESLMFSDKDLAPETTYTYKVRAFDGSVYSQFSTIVSATTKAEKSTTPVPTIPIDPDVSERRPSVEEKFSYVLVGSEKRSFSSIGEIKEGEELTIGGGTVAYSNIEIVVNPIKKSFYTQADNKGIWDIKINTDEFTPGEFNFKIIIDTENYPEKYESEEYFFEVLEVEKKEENDVQENTFGSQVNTIVLIVLAVVVVLFLLLIFITIKKGWLKKIFGKESDDFGNQPPTSSSTPKSFEQSIGDIDTSVLETDKSSTQNNQIAQGQPNMVNPPVTEISTFSQDNLQNTSTQIPQSHPQNPEPIVSLQDSPTGENVGSVSGNEVHDYSTISNIGVDQSSINSDEMVVSDRSPLNNIKFEEATSADDSTNPR